MAEVKVEGMEEFLDLLVATEKETERIIAKSIYPGAKIVADTCKVFMEQHIVTEEYHSRHRQHHFPSPLQLKGLIDSMGIAKMKRKEGGVFDVKLGFDGYNEVKTKKYPKGQPNAMIARSINGGTSYMQKQPFMDMTVRVSKAKAEAAIEQKFNEELERFWSKQGGGKFYKDYL